MSLKNDTKPLKKQDRELIKAAKQGDCKLGRQLLKRGAGINAVSDERPWSVLRTATLYGHVEFVKMLLENGVDVNKDNCLLAAISRSETECVKLLIQHGCELLVDEDSGKSALHYATQACDEDIIKFLVEQGADVNLQDKRGNTPLMELLTGSGCSDIVEYLIKNGTDVNIVNDQGRSAVHYCTIWGDEKYMKLVLDANANVNVPETFNEGDYPIHSLKHTSLLIEAGADVNVKDSDGYTPFHKAVKFLMLDEVMILKGSGCEVDATNNDGITPLVTLASMTRKSGNIVKIAEVLINLGAEVNARDQKGNTPLMMAAKNGNADLTLLLVNAGADLTVSNAFNQTALELASVSDIITLLKSKLEERDACSIYNESMSTMAKLLSVIQSDDQLDEDGKVQGIQKVRELEVWLSAVVDTRSGEGVMTSQHRAALRENRLLLVEEMSPMTLFSHFIQNNILTDNDVDDIKLEGTRKRMCEKLLDVIGRRGDVGFTVLCDALTDNGQQYLVDILQKD